MAGNQGDQGDQGDQGNLGSAAGGWNAPAFADRVDFPFISVPDVADQRLARTSFGLRNWETQWWIWHTLADFASTPWRQTLDSTVKAPGPVLPEDIEYLRIAALDERADALAEILRQDREFISYFLAAMGGNAETRPATYRLFHIANLVVTLVVMHFKLKYDYPRPSHICPALLPPIQVPGHASYPSGHATQSRLFALLGREVMPAPHQNEMGEVLEKLADRIARNREIAGVHYEKDSNAGKCLAQGIFDMIKDETVMPHDSGQPSKFADAIAAARAEWA